MSNSPSIFNPRSFWEEKAEWLRFVKVVVLCAVIPLAVMFVLSFYLAWRTGEFMPDREAADLQRANPDLLWDAHDDADYARFKLVRLDQERPEVLIMGNSRAKSFSRPMFQPYSFYNLARVSWPYSTYPGLLDHFPPGYEPRVIIFTLDYLIFNKGYTEEFAKAAPRYEDKPLERAVFTLHMAYRAICEDPTCLFSASRRSIIGLHYMENRDAIRNDGSVKSNPRDLQIPYDTDMLGKAPWNAVSNLRYGDAMDPNEMKAFEKFAAMARARGITLVGVQMPMYGPVVHAIEASPHYGILKDFEAHLRSGYFDRLGIITFDYLEFPPYDEDYRNFADMFHPMPSMSGRVLLKMMEDPRMKALLPKIDTGALGRMVDETAKAERSKPFQ